MKVGVALIEEFIREAQAAGAAARRVSRGGLTDLLVEVLEGDRTVVAVAELKELAEELCERGLDVRCAAAEVAGAVDAGPSEMAEVLTEAHAGLGVALAGIASSGTVVVGPGAGIEGAVSILPPHHVVLLTAASIEPDLAAALETVAPVVATPGARLAFVTGPSRTSDIELTPVVGVHGPLRLDVLIVDG